MHPSSSARPPRRCQAVHNCLIWFCSLKTQSRVHAHSLRLTGCCSLKALARRPVRLTVCFIRHVYKCEPPAPPSLREKGVIYQGERMTTGALIVNHWQHYWTTTPSPIWICVGKPVINQSITHRSVCTQTKMVINVVITGLAAV